MNQDNIFTKDGLYITPRGYFLSKWSVDKQAYEGKKLHKDDIEKYLSSPVYFDNDVRVKHIFEPIWDSVVFSIVFRRNFWNEMMHELKTIPWPQWIGDTKRKSKADGSDIEYVEVYKLITFDSNTKTLENSSHWDFHGVGYPIQTEKVANKHYSKIGNRIPFAIEFESLAKYMNFPIQIGKSSIYDESKSSKEIFSGQGNITFYELIHAITWEMSFSGVGKQRDEFLQSTLNTVKKIQKKSKEEKKKK